MQTRDGLTDNITPQYTDRSIPSDALRPYPATIRTLAVIAAWLVPGAGHLVLGRFGRALLFMVCIIGSFILGLSLHGRLYWPSASETPGSSSIDLVSILWFFAQIGSGLCYIVSYLLGLGTTPQPQAATFEYGNTFLFLSGLLNYLVIHDAFDIAAGRKR